MGKWYALQVSVGGEELFCKNVSKLAQEHGLHNLIEEIVVPIRKKGPEDLVGEKILPGYVLVRADMTGPLVNFFPKVPRFARFVGGFPPVAMQDKEVKSLLENVKKSVSESDNTIFVGGKASVIKGPFSGFVGDIVSIETEERRVQLLVTIFGRPTMITVDMNQLEG